MKKNLLEVVNNKEIMKKIFNANEKLQQEWYESEAYITLDFISQDLNKLDGISYEFDMTTVNIRIFDYDNFIKTLYNKAVLVEDGVCYVAEASYNEQDKKLIARLLEGFNSLYYKNLSEKNYNRLDEWLIEKCDILAEKLKKKIKEYILETEKLENIFDSFFNNFNVSIADKFYFDENFILYENIVKCYK